MSRATRIILSAPLAEEHGQIVPLEDFADIDSIFKLAEMRTARFNDVIKSELMTLRETLAAAYIQGMSDASRKEGSEE